MWLCGGGNLQYDEFGNFLGELSDSDGEGGGLEGGFFEGSGGDAGGVAMDEDVDMDEMERRAALRDEAGGSGGAASTAVVLHEDKKFYPTAEEVYGAGTEAVYHDEDAQDIEEPLVPRVEHRADASERVVGGGGEDGEEEGDAEAEEAFPMRCGAAFLRALAATPATARQVVLAGHVHHGKSSVVDLLVRASHQADSLPGGGKGAASNGGKPMRYTDARDDERARGMSIKATPVTAVCESSRGKSYALGLIDAPGHADLVDEAVASMRLVDGAVVVVDAVEGVMLQTERALKAAAREGLAVCVVINKVDRLITELKLPPTDAYFKLRHTLDEANAVLEAAGGDSIQRLDPVAGNVCFASAAYEFCFSLKSFARLYAEVHGLPVDAEALAARMWGNIYYHPGSRAFRKRPPPEDADPRRSFVEFVLEPLYKIFALCVGEHPKSVARALAGLGVRLPPSAYKQDVRPLLRDACAAVFGDMSSLVDMLVEHVPPTDAGARAKVAAHYSGPADGPLAQQMARCATEGPLAVQVTKLYQRGDGTTFDALGRVLSGTLRRGAAVRVLGEAYTPDDDEDSALRSVDGLWIPQARYRVPLEQASAGQLVLIGGVGASVAKAATLMADVDEVDDDEAHIFRSLSFGDAAAVVKIAVEPLNPSELPKVVEGLRAINKTYPLAVTKVEESGEHTILGTGEVFLDSVMRDLRELYANVEVKVSDPVTCFRETVSETSALKCYAETPNGRNKLTMVAEPLDKGLAEDIEARAVDLSWPRRRVANFFTEKYSWDALAARSVWAFGPDPSAGPNALLDDTIGEVDPDMLKAIRESVSQGFRWGAREGPLCDEPVRGVRFRLLDATVADEPMFRGGGQVIPTARRVCFSSMLTASPRLMEPVYYAEIQTPSDCMSAIYTVLSKRRGHVLGDAPVAGTPVYTVKAYVPAIESFGLETDIRFHTQGQAFPQMTFDHWAVVPGDPCDRGAILRPLEPAPTMHLAREFAVKTRRRKGLADDISVRRYIDDDALVELARADEALAAIL